MTFVHLTPGCGDDVVTHEILARLADRWSVFVIHMIDGGPIRFSSLKRKISETSPISSRALTRTLKQLERDGFIARKAHPILPPKVDYSLTPLGAQFLELSAKVLDWTTTYRAEIEAAHEHFAAPANDHAPWAASAPTIRAA